jgi:hypothetical protein
MQIVCSRLWLPIGPQDVLDDVAMEAMPGRESKQLHQRFGFA